MVLPPLEASTEWVETDDGKRLRWNCPECGSEYYYERRYATVRCSECDRIMQAKDYDVDSQNPDPQNPKEYLRRVARRRGFPRDYYFPEDENQTQDPLAW